MANIKNTYEKEPVMMREVYCNTLVELAKTNKNIVMLDADLISSSGTKPFAKAYPERTFNCGVAEANMVGVAAGLSATGKIPFAHSFGTFASRRCLDQIFVSAAYAQLNVRIVGSDPGVTAAYNGGTHMPFEDMASLRAIPQITLVEPTDTVMLAQIIEQLATAYGVYYIRLQRKNAVSIYQPDSEFTIGKGVLLRQGADVTIVAAGIMVAEALKAADMLAAEGIAAEVIDMFTWKPIDKELLVQSITKTGAVVTAENHNVINGLGSAVSEVITDNCPAPLERVGVQDLFGEVGEEPYLKERFKLTAADIAASAKKSIGRKK